MNYAFLAAGFFAFHLLFAYLVDRIDINVAFAIAAATSVALCVGYLRLVLGAGGAHRDRGRPVRVPRAVQLQLLLRGTHGSGHHGRLGATLGYFMMKTARVDWETAFSKPKGLPIAEPFSSGPA